jgi:hypothetical protein
MIKIISNRIRTFLFTALLIGHTVNFCFANNLKSKTNPPKQKTITITLKLKSGAKVKVVKADLKYNKHLAYSFTLDDGYRSAYLTAFPLLNGGRVSPPMPDEWKNDQGGDGSHSDGLFFSDGCGNKIPFKLGLAINGGAIRDLPANRGHLSWPEIKEMDRSGWDILNHGFHHATKNGTNFLKEVTENTLVIKQQLGFTTSQFVVPGGEGDPGYEKEYERDALENGCFSVASYKGAGPIFAVNTIVNLEKMVYARTFVRSTNDTIDFKVMDTYLKTLDSLMKQPKPIWYNEFTHGVGNSNLWSLSMRFPEFKYYMTAIAQKYGSKGTDAIWMAPWQEVYEYIWLRDRIKVDIQQKKKEVILKITLPEIPDTFRHRAISLAIDSPSEFTTESNSTEYTIVDDGQKSHKLITIEWK